MKITIDIEWREGTEVTDALVRKVENKVKQAVGDALFDTMEVQNWPMEFARGEDLAMGLLRRVVRTVEADLGYRTGDYEWILIDRNESRHTITKDQAFFVMEKILGWKIERGDDGSFTVHVKHGG